MGLLFKTFLFLYYSSFEDDVQTDPASERDCFLSNSEGKIGVAKIDWIR